MMTLIKDEKTGVVYRKWSAPSPKAVLLLVHGISTHSGRWQFLAEYFLTNNISSYAIEMKGFCLPKGLKAPQESLDSFFNDICHLCDLIKKECPGCKIFVIGESAGGIVSFLSATLKPDYFDGLVCISPAFASKIDLNLADYLKIFTSSISDPGRQFTLPIAPDMCTRDSDYLKIVDSEREQYQCTTARLLVGLIFAQIRCRMLRSKIKIPVLFLIAGDDNIVDPMVSVKMFKSLRIRDKKLIEYPGMRHSLSIELGRELIFHDIFKWLQERI